MSYLAQTGAQEAADALAAIGERAADLTPVWPAVYARFLQGEADRFDAEGPGWAPLALSTVQQKARYGWSPLILEATGAMKASLTAAGTPGAIFRPAPDGVVMGTDYRSPRQSGAWAATALAAFHQEGTTKMPARPVIEADDSYVEDFAPLVMDYLALGNAPTAAEV